MTATTTKLRELAKPVAACTCPPERDHKLGCQDTVTIAALARLVLNLEAALTTVMEIVEAEDEPLLGATLEATIAAHVALADVEELEL